MKLKAQQKKYLSSAEGMKLLDSASALLTVSLFCCNIENLLVPLEVRGRIFCRLLLETPANIIGKLKETKNFAATLSNSKNLYNFQFIWDEDTYTVQFTLKFYQLGTCSLIITYNGLPISGSPFAVKILGTSASSNFKI